MGKEVIGLGLNGKASAGVTGKQGTGPGLSKSISKLSRKEKQRIKKSLYRKKKKQRRK